VRLSDADPAGRLRFDAAARYLHDVSNDDTRDSGLRDDGSWVVRRTVLSVAQAPRLFETLELATWCSGVGSRWAERTVTMSGNRGGSIEARSLWVYIDIASMMPKRLGADFLALYGEGAVPVASKLLLPGPPADVQRTPWPLRRTDLDVMDHVNNAAYWAAVEEVAPAELVTVPHEAVLEFARPIDAGADVQLAVASGDAGIRAWLEVAGTVHAAASLAPTPR
jgi:acyl-ACP thioesterase